jgi:esterase/lipase superfamily enzyme
MFAQLLNQLEAAVRAGDRVRALELARLIQQQLVRDQHDQAVVERRVRELLAELQAPAAPPRVVDFAAHEAVRGLAPAGVPGVVYPVWFGTNRKPNALGTGFTGERHDRVTRGRVEVYVPEAHRFGETGTPFWTKLLRFDLRDDSLRVQRVERQERDAFFAEIQAALHTARESGESPHALVFLHGFNVSFEEAAIRAAQIGVDLKVPGATAFFSWPSRGSVRAYPADEASIEASERAITEFLVDFTSHCQAEQVHLIAHSMGNRGLLRALQRIAAQAQTQGQVRFGQIFLAAPDVDRDLFLDLARLYPEHAERTTLYASDGDLPVHLSAKLHDAPRAGYYTPYTVAPGIDTVAVPDFDLDLLGHAYFAQAEALLHDIHDLMRHGEEPRKRQRITPDVQNGVAFWKLRR